MLNTPYERGWRDAADGKHPLRHQSRGYYNGYKDAHLHGYGRQPVILPPASPAVPEELPGFWSRVKGWFL